MAVAIATAGTVGCGGGDGGPDGDAGADVAADLPACPTGGALYFVSLAGQRSELTEGSKVGITLGFQGFQFSNLGLVAADALDPIVTVHSSTLVPGQIDRGTRHPNTRTRAVAGGWETEPVTVFFNDVPLAELVGKSATLGLRVTGTTCQAVGSVNVVLEEGGFEGPDGGP